MSAPNNVYASIKNSLFAVCKSFADNMNTQFPENAVLSIYNFDAFSEENGLPDGDLIGMRSISIDVDSELATFRAMVGISTQNDENLFRLDEYSGLLLKRFLPDQVVVIYDSETGQPCGQAKLYNGTSMSPILKAVQRPLKFIAISGGLGLALTP